MKISSCSLDQNKLLITTKIFFCFLFIFMIGSIQLFGQNSSTKSGSKVLVKSDNDQKGKKVEPSKPSRPVYVSTGDSAADLQRYYLQKKKYLEDHPEIKRPQPIVQKQIPNGKKEDEAKREIKGEKIHYVIRTLRKGVLMEPYSKALEGFNRIDQFRYYETDRTIYFEDGEVAVTLLSAKHLHEKYGRRISPATIYKPEDAKAVEFILTEDGRVKEKLILPKK